MCKLKTTHFSRPKNTIGHDPKKEGRCKFSIQNICLTPVVYTADRQTDMQTCLFGVLYKDSTLTTISK